MMMSPSSVYEKLKGKSDEEVLLEIKKYKRAISRLKKQLEHAGECELCVCPSPDVQIACLREYIDVAKQALIERGVECKQTRAERRSYDFNASLSEVVEICVVRGSFLGSCKKYVIAVEENCQTVTYSFGYGIEFSKIDSWNVYMKKAEFVSELEKLYIGEWKRYYHANVLDGEQWEVAFMLANGIRYRFEGTNAYPYNFYDLMELLAIVEDA